METVDLVLAILLAAAVGEAICEFFWFPLLDPFKGKMNETIRTAAMRFWSALWGVGIACWLGLNIFELIGLAPNPPWVGWILTGFLLGRGSNFVHDLIKRLGARFEPRPEVIEQLDIVQGR